MKSLELYADKRLEGALECDPETSRCQHDLKWQKVYIEASPVNAQTSYFGI